MGRVEVNGILDRIGNRNSNRCYNGLRYTIVANQVWHFAGGNDMRNIRELVQHIEEQIAHKDAREPGAQWIVDELKKYLVGKESCQWCGIKIEGKVLIDLDDNWKADVCQTCAWDYVNGNFDTIKKKIDGKEFVT